MHSKELPSLVISFSKEFAIKNLAEKTGYDIHRHKRINKQHYSHATPSPLELSPLESSLGGIGEFRCFSSAHHCATLVLPYLSPWLACFFLSPSFPHSHFPFFSSVFHRFPFFLLFYVIEYMEKKRYFRTQASFY